MGQLSAWNSRCSMHSKRYIIQTPLRQFDLSVKVAHAVSAPSVDAYSTSVHPSPRCSTWCGRGTTARYVSMSSGSTSPAQRTRTCSTTYKMQLRTRYLSSQMPRTHAASGFSYTPAAPNMWRISSIVIDCGTRSATTVRAHEGLSFGSGSGRRRRKLDRA